MCATDELRNEHDLLRTKLTQLEEWLPIAHAAPWTILRLIGAMSRRLRAHTEHEESLFATLQETLQGPEAASAHRLLAEHKVQRHTLTALCELFTTHPRCPIDEATADVARLIEGLRELMTREENDLFSFVDRFLPKEVRPLAYLKRSSGGTVPMPELLWRSCDGMMVIDERRRILAMSPSMERLTGRQMHDVVGRVECGVLLGCHDRHGCPLADHPDKCPGLRAMRRLRPVKAAEYTIRTASGHKRVMSCSYTPIQQTPKSPVLALAVMRDLTHQKWRENRLAASAMTDPLTRLLNRTAFLDACSKELRRAGRHVRPLAIAMADLDGFKAYDDTRGHMAGDELLKAVAEVLQTGRRATEVVARYGGDEFVILFPDATPAEARAAAERIRQTITELPCFQPNGRRGTWRSTLTVSVGIAAFPDDGMTINALLAKADERFYEAKQRSSTV